MPYTEVNDIRMYYEEHGSGVPFILLHGALGAIDELNADWSRTRAQFSRHYRVIEIEHRGHGRTNNPAATLTYEMIASDVIEFINTHEIGPVHLGGISDGAIASLLIGMTRSELVQTIISIGANYYNDDLVVAANQFFDVKRIEQLEGKAEQYAATHDRNKFSGYWRQLIEQLAANLAVSPNYRIEEFRRILPPTFLIAGENDPYANPRQMVDMRAAIPNAEMLIVNNAGHLVQNSHPQLVGSAILDFLARHSNKKEH